MHWQYPTLIRRVTLLSCLLLAQACNGNARGSLAAYHAPASQPADEPTPDPDSSPSTGDANTTTTTTGNGVGPGNANGPVDPNASLCANANFSICDGFESAPVNSQTWKLLTQNQGDTVEQDATRAARGKGSVHFHTVNGGYERAMITNSTFAKTNNTFFGRAFMYVASPLPQAHFTLFTALGTLPGASAPTESRYGGQFGFYIANYTEGDMYQHAGTWDGSQWTNTTPVPTDRWVCMEWQFKGDTNEMHLWQDEMPIKSMDILGASTDDCCKGKTWTAPPYNTMALGWEIYSASDTNLHMFDVWMDEIALDTSRIGCTR